MEKTDRKQVAIYSRKSKFTGKGESIGNQIELCRQYIRLHEGPDGSGITAESCLLYEDEGFSGGNLERPRFKQMMRDARAGKISSVIVYRLDRISRNIGDFAALIDELSSLGISFVSIREQFDTASPMGRAMMYIASVFSQLERETIAERIRDNLRELAKTGRWLGGTTPTGYESEHVMSVTVDGKVKKACKLKRLPEEVELVELIFQIFTETGSLTETERYLSSHGFVTKNKKPFSRFALKGILSNPVYLKADREAYAYLQEQGVELSEVEDRFDGNHGMMVYNRTLQRAGKSHQILPPSEWIAAIGAHEGLISGRKWVKAQELLSDNCKKRGGQSTKENGALLSGLLCCGNCGGCMRAKLSGYSPDFKNRRFSYLCTRKEKSGGKECEMGNVRGIKLDEAVLDVLGGLEEDRICLCRYLEAGRKRFLEETEQKEGTILGRRIEALNREIEGLVRALGKAAGTPSEPYIRKQIEELHLRMENTKGNLERVQKERAKMKQGDPEQISEEEADKICRICCSFRAVLDEVSTEEKRKMCRTLMSGAVWDGQKLLLCFESLQK